jgi:hypothetical protein
VAVLLQTQDSGAGRRGVAAIDRNVAALEELLAKAHW